MLTVKLFSRLLKEPADRFQLFFEGMLSADFTRRQLIAFLDELRFGFCDV